MQEDLDENFPELEIDLIGVNQIGSEPGNENMSEGRDLPWLQDLDVDSNGANDVRSDLWDVTYRDVVILDQEGAFVEQFNVTTYDLSVAENYNALRQKLIGTAITGWQNPANQFDVDSNGIVNTLDLLHIIRDLNDKGNRALANNGNTGSDLFVDVNGDDIVNPLDLIQVIRELNRIAASDTPEGEAETTSQPGHQISISNTLALNVNILNPLGFVEFSVSDNNTITNNSVTLPMDGNQSINVAAQKSNSREDILVTVAQPREKTIVPLSTASESVDFTHEQILSAHDFLFATLV